MDQSVTSTGSHKIYWSTEDIDRTVSESKVVVFAKGTIDEPRCGFSERIFSLMNSSKRPFKVVDVCENTSISAALKAYVGRQHPPVVFINGKMVGTSDTTEEMIDNGDLLSKVEKAFVK